MNNDDKDAQIIKVVLLGDTSVGKSSLALRFVSNEFKPYSESTIGASFMSKTISMPESSRKIAFKIWDTAGQEKYACLAPMYYRGAAAAILVYDICKKSSFQTLQKWVEELRCNGPSDIALIVCGNKTDLAEKYRQVETSTGKIYAESIGATFFEASAKEDWNVESLFHAIGEKVITASTTEDILEGENGARFNLEDFPPPAVYSRSSAWLSSFC